jgi:hypothetical protein
MPYPKTNIVKPIKIAKKGVVRAIKPFREKILFKYYLKKNIPVFVYQMGKVGSKSVYKSLRQYYTGVVLHAHYFDPNHVDWRIRRLYQWVIKKGMPLNIISLTREPISRNVSAFFQNLDSITGVSYHIGNFSLDELKSIFLTKYQHEKPLQWFDKNIKENFGIDVYVNSFPKCGYAIYCNQKIRLLVMRSEMSDTKKVKVIRDFLHCNNFHLVNTNISEEKEYALIYKNFRDNVSFPKIYIDMMCNSKYFNYFYEQDVINAVEKKWGEG